MHDETSRSSAVTTLLASVRQGDREALDRLFSLVYDELRRLAGHQMRCGGWLNVDVLWAGALVLTGLVILIS